MTEPTYSFTLTETERAAFAKVLGGLVSKLINAPVQVEMMTGVQCERCCAPLDDKGKCPICGNPPARITSQVPPARPADPTPGLGAQRALREMQNAPPAAAQSTPTANPIALRDRWARDRKGNELPNPEGCYPADVHLWKTEQKEKYLRVTWETSSGFADANCFDAKLWPWLIQAKAAGQKTRLYLVAKGKYLNIVGARA